MKHVVLLMTLFCIIASCKARTGVENEGNQGKSGLSSISLSLPDRSKIAPDAQTKLTAYHVIIEPMLENCNEAKPIDIVDKWEVTSTPSYKIKKGCDYSIGMELGKLDETGKVLKPVYFTNWTGSKKGELLKATTEDLIKMQVHLKITDEGRAAGLGSALPSTGDSDLSIEVIVGDQPNPTPSPTPTTTPTPAGDFTVKDVKIEFDDEKECIQQFVVTFSHPVDLKTFVSKDSAESNVLVYPDGREDLSEGKTSIIEADTLRQVIKFKFTDWDCCKSVDPQFDTVKFAKGIKDKDGKSLTKEHTVKIQYPED